MFNIIRRHWPTILVSLAFLSIFGQAVRKGFQPGMPAYGDGFSFPFSPTEALQTFRSAWDLRNPGMDLPVASVLSFLTVFEAMAGVLAGGDMIIPSRLFYFYLPIPLMFLSMYWFLGKFSFSRPAKFIASLVYASNYFAIGEVLGGFPGTNYVQILFPIILYCLYLNKFLWFSVLFSLAYIFSDHIIIFIAPFFLLFLIRGYLNSGFKGLIGNTAFVVNATALVILLTLPYTYYYFKVAFPFLGGAPLREDVLAFLVRNVNDTYRYFTLGNALRLGGSSYMELFKLSTLTVKVGFVIPLLAFSWFFLPANRSGQKLKIGILFTLLALAMISFIYDAHRSEEIFLFRKLPFLFRFRNPARPTLFLAFCYAPLIALTIDGIYKLLFVKLKRKLAILVSVALTLTIFISISYYLKPFYSGDYDFSITRGTTYTIRERYYKISEWLADKRLSDGDFRTLWLPYNHEEVEIKIRYIDPYAYAVPINYGTYMDNDYLRWMKSVYLKMSLGDYSFSDDLGKAGVKYLVLNEESREGGAARFEYDYLTPWLPGSAAKWEEKILSNKSFTKVTEISGFKLYENTAYAVNKVDPVLAGYPPANFASLQAFKDKLILVCLFSWLLVLSGLYRRPVLTFLKRINTNENRPN